MRRERGMMNRHARFQPEQLAFGHDVIAPTSRHRIAAVERLNLFFGQKVTVVRIKKIYVLAAADLEEEIGVVIKVIRRNMLWEKR